MSNCFKIVQPFNESYSEYYNAVRSEWLNLQEQLSGAYANFVQAVCRGGWDPKTYWDEYTKFVSEQRAGCEQFSETADATFKDYTARLQEIWSSFDAQALTPGCLSTILQFNNAAACTAAAAQCICWPYVAASEQKKG